MFYYTIRIDIGKVIQVESNPLQFSHPFSWPPHPPIPIHSDFKQIPSAGKKCTATADPFLLTILRKIAQQTGLEWKISNQEN